MLYVHNLTSHKIYGTGHNMSTMYIHLHTNSCNILVTIHGIRV